MQKIYVLLRNNQQTGPYSLQEIIQFDLKPYDLIWIEGKSAGWWYPQEIGALHPYLDFLPARQHQTPPAATAVQPVLTAAPTIRVEESPLAATVARPTPVPEVEPPGLRPASANLEEAVFAQFREPVTTLQTPTAIPMPARQKRKAPPAALLALTTVLVVGGVFAASWILNREPAENNTANLSIPTTPNEITSPAVATNDKTPSLPVVKAKRKPSKTAAAVPLQTNVRTSTRSSNPSTTGSPVAATGMEVPATAPEKETPVTIQDETGSTANTPAATPEKKKSLREKIIDIFRRKPEEQKGEEAKPAETGNGERRAKRRDEATNLSQQVSIRFDVPNSWMMGIKGAKAILYNKSNETVAKAVIEVSYYNDDNELLQKKTVTFSKVDAKESKTVAIPDHDTATKVEYSLVSVEGPAA